MSKLKIGALALLIAAGASYGAVKLLNQSSEPQEDSTLLCDGMPPLPVKLLSASLSGSYVVKVFGDGKSQIIHAPVARCLLLENPK